MIKFHAECMACLAQSALRKSEGIRDERLRAEYMRRVCRIMAEADLEYHSAPLIDAQLTRLRREFLGIDADYSAIKRDFNQLLLGIYDRMQARVAAARDPVLAAIQLAMAGNYVDFNVVRDVSADRLAEMIDEAANIAIDPGEYARFLNELEGPGEIVYFHDNCGEIVLDKLLIETLCARCPELRVLSVVRETPVTNDASFDDAREIGLGDVAEVMGNGIPDLPGTQLDLLPDALRRRVENARLVIAKGQGNFESLIGCGLNVYYLFLCKCELYVKWFGLERFSGMFINERRLELREGFDQNFGK